MNIGRLLFAIAASAIAVLAADQQMLRMLPADSAFIAGIRADQVRTSRFGQFILDQLKTEEANMNQFISATGFDPRRDLTELVVASSNPRGAGATVVVARGQFDLAKIQMFAAKNGVGSQTYQGVALMTGHDGKAGQGVLAVLDTNTAVAGELAAVKSAIDRYKAGGAGMLDPQTVNKIMELSSKYDAWMMSASLARLADDVSHPQLGGVMAGDLMKSMESVIGGLRFGANIELMAEATMRSEKDAAALVDVVKFLTGMLQLSSQNDKRATEMAKLLDKMELNATGTLFRLSLAIPEDVVEGLVKPAALRGKNSTVI